MKEKKNGIEKIKSNDDGDHVHDRENGTENYWISLECSLFTQCVWWR